MTDSMLEAKQMCPVAGSSVQENVKHVPIFEVSDILV